jgi:hypothetical protein
MVSISANTCVAARERTELAIDRADARVEQVDHSQRFSDQARRTVRSGPYGVAERRDRAFA